MGAAASIGRGHNDPLAAPERAQPVVRASCRGRILAKLSHSRLSRLSLCAPYDCTHRIAISLASALFDRNRPAIARAEGLHPRTLPPSPPSFVRVVSWDKVLNTRRVGGLYI